MAIWKVQVRGTINDEVEVEADNEGEAELMALEAWRYVEYEDLYVRGEIVKVQD
jgi:hypothetical protein